MRRIGVVVMVAALGACGGGGSGSSSTSTPAPVPSVSPGGIWEGTESVTGLGVLGLVTESGEFHFIRGDNAQFIGTATMNGNTLSSSFEAFTPIGFVFPDGSTHGTGTLSATVQQRSSISGSTQTRTDNGISSSGTISLAFNSLYNRASSLAAIAGNFREPTSGAIVSINSAGVAFAQDAVSGCVLNGSVSLINPSFNAYRVQWTYSSCLGAAAFRNGLTFRGLATLDNTGSPEEIVLGATAASGAARYALVWTLQRT